MKTAVGGYLNGINATDIYALLVNVVNEVRPSLQQYSETRMDVACLRLIDVDAGIL